MYYNDPLLAMFLMLQSPQFKRDGDKEIPEPFAEVARFFVESRLLQRDIKVQLEGVSNQLVLGTFIHPVSCCTCSSLHHQRRHVIVLDPDENGP